MIICVGICYGWFSNKFFSKIKQKDINLPGLV